MLDSEFQRFCQIWCASMDILSRPRPDEVAMALIFKALKTFTVEQVAEALEYHLQNSRMPPTPSDICRFYAQDAQAKSQMAFQLVIDTVKKIGCYRSVTFRSPAVHYAIQTMGGWEAVGRWNDEDLPFRQKEFTALVEKYARGKGSWGAQAPRILIGATARSNRSLPEEKRALVDNRVWDAVNNLLSDSEGPVQSIAEKVEGARKELLEQHEGMRKELERYMKPEVKKGEQ